jgi:hypothetical protein
MDDRLALVLVVLLVASAGCSDVTGEVGGTDTAAGESALTAYPKDGTTLNGSTLRQQHVNSLINSGSFETYATIRIGDETRGTRFETTARVNRSVNRASSVTRLTTIAPTNDRNRTVARYTAGDRTVERIIVTSQGERNVRNRSARAPYTRTPVQEVNATQQAAGQFVEYVVDSLSWSRGPVSRLNGTPVTQYNATGIERRDRLTSLLGGAENVSGVKATIRVDRRGIVRELQFRADAVFDGTPGKYELVIRFRGVGRTTVTRPPWVSTVGS